MKEQFTQEEWLNEGTTVYALQDSTRHGKPIKINRFQFNIQGKCSDEELLANAVLAKAAPKMYRLLQEFMPCDEDGNGDGDFLYSEGSEFMGDRVNKLLAEARGEK